MKQIKSYTSIWNVEKILYAVNDLTLPFPVTYNQIAWFVVTLMFVIFFGDIPPFSLIQGELLKYVVFPVFVTWFMSQKTFDGKKPFRFVKTVLLYALRPKVTYAGRPVKYQQQQIDESITVVRSEKYVSN